MKMKKKKNASNLWKCNWYLELFFEYFNKKLLYETENTYIYALEKPKI